MVSFFRELSLPVTLRDDDLKSVDPYSKSPVDLNICHRKFLRHIVDPKTTSHWPTSQLFSLHISFARLPQAEFTVFLASQSIVRINENAALCSTATVIDGLTIERRISEPNSQATTQPISSSYQVTSAVNRLTENVVLNCYESSSQDVLFTDLDPFQPTEERLLLMLLVNRMGPMQIKRPKPTKTGRDGPPGSAVDLPHYRRPVGVACVDITRLVISHLNRSGCAEISTRLQDGSGMTTGFQTPRLISVVTTGEQFQTDSLLNLAKHTPLAYFAKPSSREVTSPILVPSGLTTLNALIDIPATSSLAAGLPVGTAVSGLTNTNTPGVSNGLLTSNSTSGISSSSSFTASSSALFSGGTDELDFVLKCIEVLDPRESQILMYSAPSKPRISCGRRFGFSNMLSVGAESDRRELFVTLISGEFNKGTKKQEKNIEVEISVRDSSGNLLNWQSKERTTPPVFHTTVYYHKNHPRWSELFTVSLPSTTTGKLRADSRALDSRLHGVIQLDEDRSANEPGELACAHLRLVCRHRSGGIGKSPGGLIRLSLLLMPLQKS
ncbi:Dedicator of cytokinesis protein 1 [Fasciolopsis buskii]|uniref:Dedicator of cytokinesis protein 1 n=1 Tax=Fasciolopsis buskii TaxID=27845 RepID=A0A8E0VEP2_9TREM|nr:Dedicator of cytokinesis protein 1 [Fasciolopsis buski]